MKKVNSLVFIFCGKIRSMINKNNKERGFVKLIILIIVVLLLMRYFNLTISGILAYFNLSWSEIINWLKQALDWFKDLFNSVK